MKFLISLLALLATTSLLYSGPIPEHYNNWIFGDNAGITFTTDGGNPKTLELMDTYRFMEGTSSISDDNGDLLYYLYLPATSNDGNPKIKSTQGTINNGTDIESGNSPSNSGIFIQDFSNPDLYYLITAPGAAISKTNKGIYYNIIDRTKNGGEGEVVVKNKLLYPNATEKITAVVNEVDNICWVITHEWNSNAFKIIRIDENGLDENITTQRIGLEHSLNDSISGIGRSAMSPNGKTLAITLLSNSSDLNQGEIELFDFNPKTGVLSNPRSLNMENLTYSISFSPNGKVLYVKGSDKIFQYDLNISDIDEMIKNRYTIDTKKVPYLYAILRGSNGVIYSGKQGNTYLDAILNPDIIGAGCNYTEDVVEVGGKLWWGLPTVINSYFTEKEEERTYEVSAPTHACLGDDIFLQIESENGDEFVAEMIRSQYISNYVREPVGPSLSTDGKESFTFKIENPSNSWPRFNFRFRIVTENGDIDTVSIPIESANCCTPFIRNWRFNEWNTSNTCYPVGYMTDYFFSPDSNVSCANEIKKPGELKSSTSANRNLENFDKTPTTGRILVGDPLPNIEMRAWYQNYATKIGTRYRFMASVCNVEKIERKIDHGRSLDMWIGIKNRNQELTLNRVDDIKYEDDWILLSGEFTAQDNYSEFQVWTLGNSMDNNISYGFAIDFVDLEFVEEYEFTVAEDTTICITDEYTPNNQFNGNIVDVNWEPTNGISNPNILNPIISPEISTKYTITLNDELGCEYIDSLFVEVDSCLPFCVPCVCYSLSDKVVELGNDYCIEGEFIPVCPDSSRIRDISLYFEYNPNLMKYSSSSTDTEELFIDGKGVLKLNFSENDYTLDEPNTFELCFTALLGSDSLTSLKVYESNMTKEEICVTISDSASIKYEACGLPYRGVIFLTQTQFYVEESDNELKIILTTEEDGNFRFVISDVNGRLIEQFELNSNGNVYSNEEVFSYSLDNLSSGVYFIRMQTPAGEVKSVKFVKK